MLKILFPRPPSPEELAEKQFVDAQRDLLNAELDLERSQANVDALKRRVSRLRALLQK